MTRCCASPPKRSVATSSPSVCGPSPGSGPRDIRSRPRGRRRSGCASSLTDRWTVTADRAARRLDALARAVRGRARRSADGLHGEPAVRPAAVARRHRRVARRTCAASHAPDCITDGECDEVLAALDQVHDEIAEDRFAFLPSDEDIHTAVERRVTELAGAAGAKLHTGAEPQRPGGHRPAAVDQARAGRRRPRGVPTCRSCCSIGPSRRATSTCPATRTSSAPSRCCSPTSCSPTAGRSARDVDRLLATVERLDVSPLGAGALAGTSLPIDPAWTAAELGFARAFDNSLDAVSDRDFVAEALFDLALIGVHLSRIGEEWVLWTTEEFGFARLDDAYATGLVDAPAEEEPRHRRARPRQVRPADRQPHRAAHHAQGSAARLQPRPPGGQGAAVRLRRPGRPGGDGAGRDDRHGDVRAGTDAGGRRRRDDRGDRPRRVAGAGAARRSARRMPSSARWSGATWRGRERSRELVAD